MRTARAEAKAAGKGGVRVRQLLGLRGSGGSPISDPEDDKLWASLESRHKVGCCGRLWVAVGGCGWLLVGWLWAAVGGCCGASLL